MLRFTVGLECDFKVLGGEDVSVSDIPKHIHDKYEIKEWRHAVAILKTDFPQEWADILYVLENFTLRKKAIAVGGGGRSQVSVEIDDLFVKRGWGKKKFETAIVVDDAKTESPTHEVDNFKNGIAIETEWNNKTAFYDRDLNNFRLLFDLRVVAVGVIITRCDELQDIFDSLGRGDSYGPSTTIVSKLYPKIDGGGGAGCPILTIGIRKVLYDQTAPLYVVVKSKIKATKRKKKGKPIEDSE